MLTQVMIPQYILVSSLFLLAVITNFVHQEKIRLYLRNLLAALMVCSFIIFLLIKIVLIRLASFLSLVELVMILSLASIISTSRDYIREFETTMRGKQIYVGGILKAYAFAFFVSWILIKLNIFVNLFNTYPSEEEILIIALLMYILGNGIESSSSFSINDMIGGFINGVTAAAIVSLVISYLFQFFHLVSENWKIFHNYLLQLTILAIILSIVSIIMIPRMNYGWKSIIKLENNNIRIGVHERSILINNNIHINLGRSFTIIPIKGKIHRGIYVKGDIKYEIRTPMKRILGTANSGIIVSNYDLEVICSIVSEAEKVEDFDLRYLGIQKELLIRDANRLLKTLMRHVINMTIIKMPFLEIIEKGETDYVRVGALTIIDGPEGGVIKIGPMRIIEENPVIFKREIYAVLNDAQRGLIWIKIKPEVYMIKTNKERIKVSKRGTIHVVNGKKIILEGEKRKIILNNIKLSVDGDRKAVLERGEKRIIIKPNTGVIILETPTKRQAITHKDKAERIFTRINMTIDKIIKAVSKESELEEVYSLLQYTNEIIERKDEFE